MIGCQMEPDQLDEPTTNLAQHPLIVSEGCFQLSQTTFIEVDRLISIYLSRYLGI